MAPRKVVSKPPIARRAGSGRPAKGTTNSKEVVGASQGRKRMVVNFKPPTKLLELVDEEDALEDEEIPAATACKRRRQGFQPPPAVGNLLWTEADEFFSDFMGLPADGRDLKSRKYDFNRAKSRFKQETVDGVFVSADCPKDQGRYMWRREHLPELSSDEKDEIEDIHLRLFGRPVGNGHMPATLAWSWYLWRRASTRINWFAYAKSVLANQFKQASKSSGSIREDWVKFVEEKQASLPHSLVPMPRMRFPGDACVDCTQEIATNLVTSSYVETLLTSGAKTTDFSTSWADSLRQENADPSVSMLESNASVSGVKSGDTAPVPFSKLSTEFLISCAGDPEIAGVETYVANAAAAVSQALKRLEGADKLQLQTACIRALTESLAQVYHSWQAFVNPSPSSVRCSENNGRRLSNGDFSAGSPDKSLLNTPGLQGGSISVCTTPASANLHAITLTPDRGSGYLPWHFQSPNLSQLEPFSDDFILAMDAYDTVHVPSAEDPEAPLHISSQATQLLHNSQPTADNISEFTTEQELDSVVSLDMHSVQSILSTATQDAVVPNVHLPHSVGMEDVATMSPEPDLNEVVPTHQSIVTSTLIGGSYPIAHVPATDVHKETEVINSELSFNSLPTTLDPIQQRAPKSEATADFLTAVADANSKELDSSSMVIIAMDTLGIVEGAADSLPSNIPVEVVTHVVVGKKCGRKPKIAVQSMQVGDLSPTKRSLRSFGAADNVEGMETSTQKRIVKKKVPFSPSTAGFPFKGTGGADIDHCIVGKRNTGNVLMKKGKKRMLGATRGAVVVTDDSPDGGRQAKAFSLSVVIQKEKAASKAKRRLNHD